MRHKNTHQKGFTLIELILTIALAVIVITSVSLFVIDILKTRAKSTSVAEVQQNVRFTMNKISYYIRNTEGGINAGSSSFSPTDPGTLYLEMGAGAADDVVIDVVSGRVRVTVGGGSSEFLTSDEVNVNSLVFTNNTASGSPRNIGVELDVEFNNPSNRTEFDYSYSANTSVTVHTP